MDAPTFPEANHPIVQSLEHHSDGELLDLFKRYPDSGRYFVALFCRYNPLVYALVRRSAPSPVQRDYLFAQIWQRIFRELGALSLSGVLNRDGDEFTLQNWLINMTALAINQADLPAVESIHYSLSAAPPPLWCYLQSAIDRQEPVGRFAAIAAQTFHWSEPRIAAYLQAEGENLSPAAVRVKLRQTYRAIEDALPQDIRAIYLVEVESLRLSSGG